MVPLRRGHSLLLHISLAKLLNRGAAHADLYIPTIVVGDPTLVLISLIIFLLLDLAPGDPSRQPLTVPPEVRQKMREALGLGALPMSATGNALGKTVLLGRAAGVRRLGGRHQFPRGSMQRIVSWQTRAPVFDIIIQRLPQTLWVVGTCLSGRRNDRDPDRHHLGLQAVFVVRPDRHLHFDDRLLGTALLLRRSDDRDLRGQLPWFPSIYDTTHRWSRLGEFRPADQADDHAGYGAGAADHGADSAASCAPRCSTTSIRTMCAPRAPRA
jgi:hypothetical protein